MVPWFVDTDWVVSMLFWRVSPWNHWECFFCLTLFTCENICHVWKQFHRYNSRNRQIYHDSQIRKPIFWAKKDSISPQIIARRPRFADLVTPTYEIQQGDRWFRIVSESPCLQAPFLCLAPFGWENWLGDGSFIDGTKGNLFFGRLYNTNTRIL